MDNDRLTRIENKLDGLTSVVVDLARINTRLNGIDKRQDDVEKDVKTNTKICYVVSVIFLPIAGILIKRAFF